MKRIAPLAAALLLALSATTAHATPDLLALTNADRATPLTADPALTAIAAARAIDMRDRDYFSHTDPDGHLIFDLMRADGYCFRIAGENIGMWLGEPSDVEAQFMGSPEHRANIQNPSWTVMGYGSATASDGRWYVVVLFALPCAAPTPQPTVLARDDPATPTQSIGTAATSAPAPTAKPTVRPTVAITSTEGK